MNAFENVHTFTQDAVDKNRFNRWIFDNILPYIKGRTLEVGSRRGAIATLFIEHNLPIHVSDENPDNRFTLNNLFRESPLLRQIHAMNFIRQDFEQAYVSYKGVFDTVVAINLTEHNYYEKPDLKNAFYLLRDRGHFIFIIPEYTTSYSLLEQSFEDWQRYNISIAMKMLDNNCKILNLQYFHWLQAASASGSNTGFSTLAVFRKTR
jgi:hypothetical protein